MEDVASGVVYLDSGLSTAEEVACVVDKSHGNSEVDHLGEKTITPDFIKSLFVIEEGRNGRGLSFLAVELVDGALGEFEDLIGYASALPETRLALA